MATKIQKTKKKQRLRNNEYYNTQDMFDKLYSQSKNNDNFYDLYTLITSEENILLAYRTMKKNKGSQTSGTNYHSIVHLGKKRA